MKLRIDKTAARRFVEVTQADVNGERRRYYVTTANDSRLALLVCRGGTELQQLAGQVVDAQIGREVGVQGFVLEPNIGREHTKITIYRQLHGRRHDAQLSGILGKAPRP